MRPGNVVETPVLIVGAGPVGLCLALDLAYRDVPSLVSLSGRTAAYGTRRLARCPAAPWSSAAAGTSRMKIRNCGFPRDYGLNMVFCTSMAGQTLGTHRYPSLDQDRAPPQSPEKKQRSPQLFFDPILAKAARRPAR